MIDQKLFSVSKKNQLIGHKDCIYTLCKNPLTKSFFSASGDGMVVEWDLDLSEDGKVFAKLTNSVYAMSVWGSKLIIAQNKEGIHVIDLATKEEDYSLKLTDEAIFDIKILNNHAYLATGNGEIMSVSLLEKKIINRQRFSTESARCISIHPSGTFILAGFSDHKIRMISVSDLSLLSESKNHTNSVFSIENYQSVFISGGRDAQLQFLKSGVDFLELKHSIAAHLFAINDIKISPDFKFLATASMDKMIKIWDFETLKLLKVIDYARFQGHRTSINKILWLDNSTLVSASDDRNIMVWELSI